MAADSAICGVQPEFAAVRRIAPRSAVAVLGVPAIAANDDFDMAVCPIDEPSTGAAASWRLDARIVRPPQ